MRLIPKTCRIVFAPSLWRDRSHHAEIFDFGLHVLSEVENEVEGGATDWWESPQSRCEFVDAGPVIAHSQPGVTEGARTAPMFSPPELGSGQGRRGLQQAAQG